MHQLTLAEIARGLADKKFSSEELTKALLARIAQLDPSSTASSPSPKTWPLAGQGR
jgi:Asp-tRNA(Asn)/Glu-tRNA(Gln) amidotransferase A subunit family amidase